MVSSPRQPSMGIRPIDTRMLLRLVTFWLGLSSRHEGPSQLTSFFTHARMHNPPAKALDNRPVPDRFKTDPPVPATSPSPYATTRPRR